MAAKAGEKACETGDFRCARCHEKTHVTKGHAMPNCRHCGHDTFHTRIHEPGSRSG
jgi:hypothetical protein